MFRSRRLQAPIITILSPCLAASKKAVKLLAILGNMESFQLTEDPSSSDEALNNIFKSSIPGLSRSWNSIGARCPISGTIVHFCSSNNLPTQKERNAKIVPFALLGITDDDSVRNNEHRDDVKVKAAITHFRSLLATRISDRASMHNTLLKLKCLINGNFTTNDLLKDISRDGLPLLSVPSKSRNNDRSIPQKSYEGRMLQSSSPFFKEIAVPYFDHATYIDGSTLTSRLYVATTNRPAVGVFEWPNSTTCIRPLPTAAEDQRLPSPSLIFHCKSPNAVRIKEYGFQEARIGYGGLGPGHGQVMLLHEDLNGLDIRYCPRTTISSTFSEAQEFLLAGSLDELQSTNILISGGDVAKSDERIGSGDCWVEVRANLKRPSKYWQRSKSRQSSRIS